MHMYTYLYTYYLLHKLGAKLVPISIIKILKLCLVFHWPVQCVAVCCRVLQCVAVNIVKILELSSVSC